MGSVIKLLIIGALGGVLGGMGMGGGTILIPMLTMFASIQQKTAQAINLISFIPMAVVAVIMHFKNGLIRKQGLLFVIIPALATAIVGSYLCSIVKTEILTRCFGGFLIALSFLQFFGDKLAKKQDNAPKKL